jgi:hypothetical protein
MHDATDSAYISDDKYDANDINYTTDDNATAPLLFFIPPHNPSAPTRVGAPVENAENAQEVENSPVLIIDRYHAFDIVYNHTMMCLDPNADDTHGATDNDCIDDDDRNHAFESGFDNDFELDMHELGD